MTGMLIRSPGGRWQEPAITAFVEEEQLKMLVKDIPSLLSDSMAFVDEFQLPGVGAVDLLGVGIDGSLTLVECKLRKNPQIRREVVGQVLAYAGGLWRTTYDDFAARYASRAGMQLVDHLQASVGTEIDDPDALRAAIHARLQAGTFTLVIAVDQITEELKRVVEFLNAHTSPGVDVLALEVDYARDGDVEILVPRTYGESAATIKGPSGGPPKLTLDDFTRVIGELGDSDTRHAFQRLLQHGRERGHHFAPGTSGMSCWYSVAEIPTSTWAMWPKDVPPTVSISLGALAAKAPESHVVRFLGRLKANERLAPHLVNVDKDQLNKFPTIPVPGTLDRPDVLDTLLSAVEELIDHQEPDSRVSQTVS